MTATGGPPLGSSRTFRGLVDGGPQTLADLSVNQVKFRTRMRYDIRKLNPSAVSHGSYTSTPRTVTVYYLNEYHDPAAVIRAWLDANEPALRAHPRFNRKTLSNTLPRPFTPAWRDIVDDYAWIRRPSDPGPDADVSRPGPGGDDDKPTCPFCNEEVERDIPAHLRNDECDEVPA